MASLAASTVPTLGIVKLALDWAPYFNEPVSLYRIEPDGRQVEILGSPITLSGSQAIAYDTTAPLDVDLTYKAVMVDPTVARSEFETNVSNSWGTPDFTIPSGSWTNTGTNSDYNVAAGEATLKLASTALARNVVLPGSYLNVRIGATISNPVVPSGAGIRTGVTTRYTDQNNHYQFNIVHNTPGTSGTGAITLNITKRLAGNDTIIASTSTEFTVATNRLFRLEAESVGSRHRMTVWWATGREDAATLEVSDAAITAAGKVGARSIALSGNTNTLPVSMSYDSVHVTEYATYTLTSGTVNVTAAPHGWIRDPLVPANSIRLDNCASHTFDCLNGNQMVFFQGFGDETYKSATGAFERNNSERPVTVAQTRKAPVTDLLFASVTLADIARVRTLFRSGRNLSLYLPVDYGWGIDSYGADMFTAGDLRSSRLNRVDMRKPYRLWSAEIAQTDLDDDLPHYTFGNNGIPIPGATLADLKATGKTLGELASGGPLNPNPYFETNTAGWVGTGAALSQTTSYSHQGAGSMLITPDGVTATVEATTPYLAVSTDRTYRLQAWVRCDSSRNVRLQAVWSNGVSETGNTGSTVAVLATIWTLISIPVVPPAGTTQTRISITMDSTPLVTDLLYVDEALLGSRTILDVAQGVF